MKYKFLSELLKSRPALMTTVCASLATALFFYIYSPDFKKVGANDDAVKKSNSSASIAKIPEKPLSSLSLKVSGISQSTPVFTIFGVDIYKDRIIATPKMMTTLDRPARRIMHLKKTMKTVILSDDQTCLYIYDDEKGKFQEQTVKFRNASGGLKKISTLALDEGEALMAVAFSGEKIVSLISCVDFLKLSELIMDFEPVSIFFGKDGNLFFTSFAQSAGAAFMKFSMLKPPYISSQQLSDIPFADGPAAFDRSGSILKIFNSKANAAFSIDAASREGKIIRPGLPPGSDDSRSSAIISNGNGIFSLIRSDIASLTVINEKSGNTSFECNFLKDGFPVVSECDELKYAFIGSNSHPKFALFKKDSSEGVRTSELPGIDSLSAACICENIKEPVEKISE